ncbi:biopolymer transport protein ExbD [Loktanella fryxellensis]|uniref:Biopolymer transport protein ExbD n=1 Tax=Loktanella fryxellensis TaxID=245187 RepID=A0A1H8HDK0_9RHOB|nr:biopolymer transporter ExbD [Loktanella fryxellensis]SEN54190.1 biopolymer transport protein ExbD [Loktanella fryxellensis]
MFDLSTPRTRRKPSLTPMIDVVFLLLVFFMLAARFGLDTTLPLVVAGGGVAYDGPLRLVEVGAEALTLNGVAVTPEGLAARLAALTDGPDDMIVLRPAAATDLQRVVDVMGVLQAAGFARVVLVEAS